MGTKEWKAGDVKYKQGKKMAGARLGIRSSLRSTAVSCQKHSFLSCLCCQQNSASRVGIENTNQHLSSLIWVFGMSVDQR